MVSARENSLQHVKATEGKGFAVCRQAQLHPAEISSLQFKLDTFSFSLIKKNGISFRFDHKGIQFRTYWEVFRKKLKPDNMFSKDNHVACSGYLLID